MASKSKQPHRGGFVAIVGRPNVGKSTLMNHILGQKISITSSKPQTTRHRILGIKTEEDYQAIYVDTPGLHLNAQKAMNRYMNRAATTSLEAVELILFVVDVNRWTEEDDNVLNRVKSLDTPVVLVINKVDQLKEKEALLPLLQSLAQKMDFAAVVPLSALKGNNIAELEKVVYQALPEAEPMFPEEYVTDRSERFLAAELVREKLMRALGKELPYATTVEIEQFKEEQGLLRINALIWVERQTQKRIVIGKGGERLKEIGRQARIDMERLFGEKVFLQLWVKVKEGWSDNERILSSLGYRDE
jgi:GTP-binding protein Era